MVFLKVAYCIKICIIKLFRDCTCFSFGKVLLIKKQNFGVVSMVLYFVYIVTLSLLAFQCVIVGLQSTGEARTLEQLEESGGDLTDFVSTAK